jgi:chromosomal replication initiation ATPase DnaA
MRVSSDTKANENDSINILIGALATSLSLLDPMIRGKLLGLTSMMTRSNISTLENWPRVIEDVDSVIKTKKPTAQAVLEAAVKCFGKELDVILSTSRKREVQAVRNAVIYVLSNNLTMGSSEIARCMNRDPSTISYNLDLVDRMFSGESIQLDACKIIMTLRSQGYAI